MTLAISLQSELLKTKRTSSFYLCILLAMLFPALYLFGMLSNGGQIANLVKDPWNLHLLEGWKALGFLVLPLFVILVSTLLPQIEYRNNTWKQLFASPQSLYNVFITKFIIVQLFILFFLLVFNAFMMLVLVIAGLALPPLKVFENSVDWKMFFQAFLRMYLLVLGMSAFQFWIGLRLRNFIAPIGIGVSLWLSSYILGVEFKWNNIDFFPHAFSMMHSSKRFLQLIDMIQWRSVCFALLFLLLAFTDLKYKKAKY